MAILGPLPAVQVKDLTVREIEEAQGYGLNPEQYLELRAKFDAKLREKLRKELKDESKSALEKELTPRLKAELRPALQAEVRAEIEAEVRVEMADSLSEREPTPKEREAFSIYARDVEVDSLVRAHASSNEVESIDSWLGMSKTINTPISGVLYLALPIVAYLLHEHFGVHSMGFYAFSISYLALAVTFGIFLSNRHDKLEKERSLLSKNALDYASLAESAKAQRMAKVETHSTREALQRNLEDLSYRKMQLDGGLNLRPRIMEVAKTEVRNQLLSEVDPEKLIRIGSDDSAFEKMESEEKRTGIHLA